MSIELAWAAGFFDGEGSVYINHRKETIRKTGKFQSAWVSIDCNIHQVRIEPLLRFKEAVGKGVVNGPYKPKTIKSRPYYMWTTAGRHNVYPIILALWPYLSLPKKEQFYKCWEELKVSRQGSKYNKNPLQDLPELN